MKNLLYILFLFSVSTVFSQETFKESKVFTKALSLKADDKIQITGERTFIYLTEWDRNTVEATVEVISRYKTQEQAQEDLDKVTVTFEKKGNTLYYSNALRIKSPEDKPKSNLKTILRLSLPSYAKVNVKNAFGELNIIGSIEELETNSQFCVTSVKNNQGDMKIASKYGKVKCEDTSGKVKIEGNRSDVSLIRVGGEVNLNLSYGNLDVTCGLNSTDYDISTEYSPVTLVLPEDSKQSLELSCSDCDIDIDNCSKIIDEKISKGKHKVTIKGASNPRQKPKIESKKEDITIISTNALSNSN